MLFQKQVVVGRHLDSRLEFVGCSSSTNTLTTQSAGGTTHDRVKDARNIKRLEIIGRSRAKTGAWSGDGTVARQISIAEIVIVKCIDVAVKADTPANSEGFGIKVAKASVGEAVIGVDYIVWGNQKCYAIVVFAKAHCSPLCRWHNIWRAHYGRCYFVVSADDISTKTGRNRNISFVICAETFASILAIGSVCCIVGRGAIGVQSR